MHQRFDIAIKESCSENFGVFQPTTDGGFCNACQKEVIDFTSLSEQEIFQYFKTGRDNTCGRFRKSQLREYSGIEYGNNHTRSLNGIGAGLVGISLISLLSVSNSSAQELKSPTAISVVENEKDSVPGTHSTIDGNMQRIEGVVTDERGEPLPFVSIVVLGTSFGATSDFDGRFAFSASLKEGDEILFSYIGFVSQIYIIGKNTSGLQTMNIKMVMDSEIVMMGKVSTNHIYSSQPSPWQRFLAFFK